MSNTPTFDPIRGELVRAGTFLCETGDADAPDLFTGIAIAMTEAELGAIKRLPFYRRIVVLTEEAHAALGNRNEHLENLLHAANTANERMKQELAAHRLAGGFA